MYKNTYSEYGSEFSTNHRVIRDCVKIRSLSLASSNNFQNPPPARAPPPSLNSLTDRFVCQARSSCVCSRPVACVAGFRRHAMPNDNGVDGDVADL